MALSSGTRVGPFEVLGLLGAGGMGEVYRARDTKLGREVALKVLLPLFAGDPERLARFQREAQLLASLNHPNIATIFGAEERALVMELVEGPTLADRIAIGAMPLEEALAIAAQIADALEYAHEKNVIHRDLKPANVKVTPDGKVKVLDFGLAKALADDPASGDVMNSPTLTLGATRAGVILGTAAYMPPEQAKGKSVDRRADIWSFGVVLYEMLTGARGYTGETAAETLAAVLKEDLDWSRLPPETPAHVRRLLRRCLEKDPKRRLRDIGEARIALEEREPASAAAPVAGPPPKARLPWAVAGALFLALAAMAWVHFREASPPERLLRYTLAAPDKAQVHTFAISPDGRQIAVAATLEGKRRLWVRPLEALEPRALPGTDDAQYPFWSPDSRFIGFFAEGKLKKIEVSGGPPQVLCDASNGRGGAWFHDGFIVFAPDPAGGLQRVAAAGGVPGSVTKTKADHRFPVPLPDGQHFLYLVSADTPDKNGVYLRSLDGQENRRILSDESSVVPAPPAPGGRDGYLLFVRDATLMAQPFDFRTRQFAGDVFPFAEHVSFGANTSFAPATASANGVVVYQTSRAVALNQLAWFDRAGKPVGIVGPPSPHISFSLSPDGGTVAFERVNTTASTGDLWLHDLSRGTETRFTFQGPRNQTPVWSPDGTRIVFSTNRSGHYDLFQKLASGAGQEEAVLATPYSKGAYQWSRDGRFLVYLEVSPKTKDDLWVLPVTPGGDRKPIPFLQTEFNDLMGQLSPDSRWMAYTSDESGRREVYVRPFPAADGKWQISTDGGEQPRWRGDGKELYYVSGRKIEAVDVKAPAGPNPSLVVSAPAALFEENLDISIGGGVNYLYDVTRDGQRFLARIAPGSESESPLTVVVNGLPNSRR